MSQKVKIRTVSATDDTWEKFKELAVNKYGQYERNLSKLLKEMVEEAYEELNNGETSEK